VKTPKPQPRLSTPPGAAPRKRKPRPRPERPGHPRCPDWIDDEAKQVWARLEPLLRELYLLTRVDGNGLARYCQTFVRWKLAEQFIQQYGETYPVKSGNGVVKCFFNFPQVATAQKLSALLTKLERELGLTPSARAQMVEVINLDFDR